MAYRCVLLPTRFSSLPDIGDHLLLCLAYSTQQESKLTEQKGREKKRCIHERHHSQACHVMQNVQMRLTNVRALLKLKAEQLMKNNVMGTERIWSV